MKKWSIIACISLSLYVYGQTGNADVVQGNALYRLAQWQQAEAAYRLALKTAPNNQVALYNLANALHQQRRYDEALAILEKLGPVAEPNLKPMVYYNQGVIHSKQKELEKSIEAYKEALRNQPNDVQARENLQKALRELKQQQQQQNQSSGGGGGMSQKEAEQKLKQLQEKERRLQQRLQQKGQQGSGGSKDW